MKKCPCHSGFPYLACCQSYHEGFPAPNACALMRSRYSAFALNLPQYIIQTTHPKNPQYRNDISQWTKELEIFSKQTLFLGLEILEVEDCGTQAHVTFHATLKQVGKDASFTEKSLFQKENGYWYYIEGIILR